ncbi:hypothetical protein [Teichococcus aestuarii]|uniref:DUF1376 domain-containing protein n=1 Tax=Teichococcus aestuarii TaxID=568898 RepID=A0A2U1UXT7_9PROT|nr:hypothetical protein [Pseudoroseomonas aestuarii]PWC26391.1 hypothetical protein CR165_23440 [Pseudoroseomonas aestuarii]
MQGSADLPEPLTPGECDLRDFPFIPLDVARLRDSDLASLPDAEARWANVLSWAVSWHQVPAGSLPDDDAALCRLLGYGRDLKGWAKVRQAGGLRGWVRCADGRLHHPVVAEKALQAWARKRAQQRRSRAGNLARWGRGDRLPAPSSSDPTRMPKASREDAASIPALSQETGTETGEMEKKTPSCPRGRGRASTLQGFDAFWRLYPRRVGRGAAERAWPKALAEAGGDPDDIVCALKARLHQFDDREGGRFIPHPATWLNGKRWLDGEGTE